MASPPVLENPRNSTLGKRRAGATATPTDAAGAREPRAKKKPAKKGRAKPGGAPRASKPREGSVGGATPQRKRRKKAEAGGASGGGTAATARGAAPAVDVDTLLLDDARITVRQANPKKAGSKSALRYDAYKAATTASEFLRLGGSKADLAHDCTKGFVTVLDDDGDAGKGPEDAKVPEDVDGKVEEN